MHGVGELERERCLEIGPALRPDPGCTAATASTLAWIRPEIDHLGLMTAIIGSVSESSPERMEKSARQRARGF